MAEILSENSVRLPKRRADSYKGDYGRVLIVGGSVGYTGAPNLSARAAVRAGAGLVYLGVPQLIWSICAVKNDEAMPFPLPCDAEGRLTEDALPLLRERWKNCGTLAIGPGLGRSDSVRALVCAVLREYSGSLVLDADALWAVSEQPELLRRGGVTVVTPHAGEFRRLGGERCGSREADAAAFAAEYGCITVLKGHETLIAFPGGRVKCLQKGNPGMAKGGSGDVLTGIIAALLGQLPPEKAVPAGAWIHAAAGDACAQRLGEYGMTPMDMIEQLPYTMKGITRE